MEKTRLEIKVGLFIFIGLALLAGLMIQFSKSTSLYRSTYELHLHAANVGGIMQQPDVDGCLVGGASLQADEFGGICRFYDMPVL